MELTPILIATLISPALVSTLDLRLVTYNIRFATANLSDNELVWSKRRPLLAEQLKKETSDNPTSLLCFQEALHSVVEDINSGLGANWSWTGVGRENGKNAGEFSPIFYRKDVWDLDASHTKWLSRTPDRPSRGWDASHKRIVTVAELSHKITRERVVFMCTHFDKGKKAQSRSSEVILDLARSYSSVPIFVAGGFSFQPQSKPYKILTSQLMDMRTVARSKEDAQVETYTGFSKDSDKSLIDFVFAKKGGNFSNVAYRVPTNVEDGKFVSDHRPVIVDVEI